MRFNSSEEEFVVTHYYKKLTYYYEKGVEYQFNAFFNWYKTGRLGAASFSKGAI